MATDQEAPTISTELQIQLTQVCTQINDSELKEKTLRDQLKRCVHDLEQQRAHAGRLESAIHTLQAAGQ